MPEVNAISGLTISKSVTADGGLDIELDSKTGKISMPRLTLVGGTASFKVLRTSTRSARTLADELVPVETIQLDVAAGTAGTVTSVVTDDTVINEFATLAYRGSSARGSAYAKIEIRYVYGDLVTAPILTFSDGASPNNFGVPHIFYRRVGNSSYIHEPREQVIARSGAGTFAKVADWLASARADSREYEFRVANGDGNVDLVIGQKKAGGPPPKKKNKLSTGAIVGIVIACVVVLAVIVFLITTFACFCHGSGGSSDTLSSSSGFEDDSDDESSI
jgi:hypothetical protein